MCHKIPFVFLSSAVESCCICHSRCDGVCLPAVQHRNPLQPHTFTPKHHACSALDFHSYCYPPVITAPLNGLELSVILLWNIDPDRHHHLLTLHRLSVLFSPIQLRTLSVVPGPPLAITPAQLLQRGLRLLFSTASGLLFRPAASIYHLPGK
ncbi:hypothetical protein FN846DRAFT_554208 [Sphaerosporella brunnea]|uniref:Secreted protein n=1 Tax=Sphaerosporella brunnea TaxID=1250544 RepID=A0A5J5F2H3_9PEZI|nr:hypothetical protein FN846DRAFT_554208 [Sphaerosporella brunnea]